MIPRTNLAAENVFASYAMTVTGLVIYLLPTAVAFFCARRWWPAHRLTISGILLGATSAPLSLFMYFQFFTDPVRGLLLGFPGLILASVHIGPFASAADASHDIVVRGMPGFLSQSLAVPPLAIASWATVYGATGAWLDRRRQRALVQPARAHLRTPVA